MDIMDRGRQGGGIRKASNANTNHLKYGFAYEQSVLVHLAVKHSVSTTVKEFCLICDIYFFMATDELCAGTTQKRMTLKKLNA